MRKNMNYQEVKQNLVDEIMNDLSGWVSPESTGRWNWPSGEHFIKLAWSTVPTEWKATAPVDDIFRLVEEASEMIDEKLEQA